MQVAFDKNALPEILNSFGNELDNEGYIIDSSTKHRVLSPDGDFIHVSEFAGITKGSKLYLKSDIASLIDFVEKFSPR